MAWSSASAERKLVWLALLASACAPKPGATPANQKLEFAQGVITSFAEEAGGGAMLGLGAMARNFRIDPADSPAPAELVAFARRAHAAKTPVHATIWVRDAGVSKADAFHDSQEKAGRPYPWVVVRLANDPDPRAPR